ncbi:hypothetical protein FQR65_LT09577 [Abscondita terminalis]|nr:hypothetical protein FQR65_LT09577 [Abscondita terminalis]
MPVVASLEVFVMTGFALSAPSDHVRGHHMRCHGVDRQQFGVADEGKTGSVGFNPRFIIIITVHYINYLDKLKTLAKRGYTNTISLRVYVVADLTHLLHRRRSFLADKMLSAFLPHTLEVVSMLCYDFIVAILYAPLLSELAIHDAVC